MEARGWDGISYIITIHEHGQRCLKMVDQIDYFGSFSGKMYHLDSSSKWKYFMMLTYLVTYSTWKTASQHQVYWNLLGGVSWQYTIPNAAGLTSKLWLVQCVPGLAAVARATI